MPTWAKVLLFLVVVGFCAMFALGLFLFRWVKKNEPALRGMNEKAIAEGHAFGRGKDADACFAEGLARASKCGTMEVVCEVRGQLFVTRCLETATLPEDFCARVPKQHEVIDTVKWQRQECERRGLVGDQRCMRMTGALQNFCWPPGSG